MDRRRFLEVSGVATAAMLTGCGGPTFSSGGTPIPAAPVVPTVPPVVTETPAYLTALAKKMQGTLILPGDPLYSAAHALSNPRFDDILPQAVARCANAGDVIEVLAVVRDQNLAVTSRCGGHSFAGYSTGTGIVIDVGPMNAISIGDGTATIGAGAKLVDVYDQLTAKNVCIPSGSCESVGIAGITMGGGWGYVGRQYGLTCDNLLSAQVVTADGQLLTCDANNEPDLFWALRGGGGGNFGIVTEFTFKTHATSDITAFFLSFSINDLTKVMTAWQAWPQTLPNNIWSSLIINSANLGTMPTLLVEGTCIGSKDDLDPYLNAFLDATQSTLLRSAYVPTVSYRVAMLDACGPLPVPQCHLEGSTPLGRIPRTVQASTSDFFDSALPEAGIKVLIDTIVAGKAKGFGGYMIFNLMGGALGAVAPDATAFVHRGALISAEYDVQLDDGVDNATIDNALAWSHGLRTAMAPWSSGRAYVNYVDPLIDDWKTAYYGDNYTRLVQVKKKYDPANIFKFAQGIPADG